MAGASATDLERTLGRVDGGVLGVLVSQNAVDGHADPQQQQAAPAEQTKSLLSRLAPYVATALLAAGGVGAGAYLARPAVEAAAGVDTDTIIEYTPGFGQPEAVE